MMHAMRRTPILLLAVALSACDDAATTSPDADLALQASRAAEHCMNVQHAGIMPLGAWMLNGQVVPGAPPAPVTLGGVSGWLASVLDVDNMRVPGNSGTTHWTLRHYFVTTAPVLVNLGPSFAVQAVDLAATASWFSTEDRAVCAAAGSDPLSCRISDTMSITDGSGIFANAGGFLHNHGTITLIDPALGIGSGDFSLRGRVCGDGV
jgi:hypothetical protein